MWVVRAGVVFGLVLCAGHVPAGQDQILLRLVVDTTYSAYWTAWHVEVRDSGEETAPVRYVMRKAEWVDRPTAARTEAFKATISMETARLIKEAFDTARRTSTEPLPEASWIGPTIRISRSGMVYSQLETRPALHPELARDLAELAESLRELCSSPFDGIESEMKRTARRLLESVRELELDGGE